MNVQYANKCVPLQQWIRGLMVGDVADRCCKVGEDEEMFVVSVRVSMLSNGVAPSHPLTKSDVDLLTSCFT